MRTYRLFMNKIRDIEWMTFVEHHKEANIAVAREFYANLPYAKENGVFVREKRVKFDPKTINDLFELPNEDGFFEAFKPTEDSDDEWEAEEGPQEFQLPTDAEIATTICNSSFMHNPNKRLNKQLTTGHFILESKIWYYFAIARLLPTKGGRNKISMKRILLVYCLTKGLQVNVGKLIHNQILTSAKSVPFLLNFPTTITLLCTRNRVKMNDFDAKETAKSAITIQYMERERKKVEAMQKEAAEARARTDNTLPPFDPWLAYQQHSAEIGYTQLMLTQILNGLNLSIPPRTAPHPGFAPPPGYVPTPTTPTYGRNEWFDLEENFGISDENMDEAGPSTGNDGME